MIIVKFFASWANDNEIYNNILKWYDWNSDIYYNNKYKITKDNDFTHAIILNPKNVQLNIPKENIIIIAQEPFNYLRGSLNPNLYNFCKKFYIGKKDDLPDPFVEKWPYQLSMVSYEKINKFIENHPEKNKIMNLTYSYKNNNDQNLLYYYRHKLGDYILNNDFDIDIYGGSTDNLRNKFGNRTNIKNKFEWDNVSEIYKNYKFCIAIENCRNPEYFTEKIIIPLLCGTIPLYLGCTNIDNYFKDYVIHLKGDFTEDIIIIKDILDNPDKYYKKVNIQEIKEIVHMKNLIFKEFFD